MIRRCVGLSAARRPAVARPRRARWGASRRSGSQAESTLRPRRSLRPMDRSRSCAPPAASVVLDTDSSVSPTHGEQENSVWNGHYECTCYHRSSSSTSSAIWSDARCVPEPSRAKWDGVLKPVVERYRGKVSRVSFRADAGFANPDVYEYLETERIKYAIRLPANRILQERIGYLLSRPLNGRPTRCADHSPISPIKPEAGRGRRRVVAEVEWHPGEPYPRSALS